jgi:hypothetical protein
MNMLVVIEDQQTKERHEDRTYKRRMQNGPVNAA